MWEEVNRCKRLITSRYIHIIIYSYPWSNTYYYTYLIAHTLGMQIISFDSWLSYRKGHGAPDTSEPTTNRKQWIVKRIPNWCWSALDRPLVHTIKYRTRKADQEHKPHSSHGTAVVVVSTDPSSHSIHCVLNWHSRRRHYIALPIEAPNKPLRTTSTKRMI